MKGLRWCLLLLALVLPAAEGLPELLRRPRPDDPGWNRAVARELLRLNRPFQALPRLEKVAPEEARWLWATHRPAVGSLVLRAQEPPVSLAPAGFRGRARVLLAPAPDLAVLLTRDHAWRVKDGSPPEEIPWMLRSMRDGDCGGTGSWTALGRNRWWKDGRVHPLPPGMGSGRTITPVDGGVWILDRRGTAWMLDGSGKVVKREDLSAYRPKALRADGLGRLWILEGFRGWPMRWRPGEPPRPSVEAWEERPSLGTEDLRTDGLGNLYLATERRRSWLLRNLSGDRRRVEMQRLPRPPALMAVSPAGGAWVWDDRDRRLFRLEWPGP